LLPASGKPDGKMLPVFAAALPVAGAGYRVARDWPAPCT
jgi:hypothetical protein